MFSRRWCVPRQLLRKGGGGNFNTPKFPKEKAEGEAETDGNQRTNEMVPVKRGDRQARVLMACQKQGKKFLEQMTRFLCL